MNPNYKIILAFGLGVAIRILSSPWILGPANPNYSIHRNKLYDALLFGSLTGLVQVLIDGNQINNAERILWIILFLSIFLFARYVIDKQLFVEEKDLLLKLKENYAESIKISEIKLNDKNLSNEVKDLLTKQNKIKRDSIQEIIDIENKTNL
jgi:hypothetical protein